MGNTLTYSHVNVGYDAFCHSIVLTRKRHEFLTFTIDKDDMFYGQIVDIINKNDGTYYDITLQGDNNPLSFKYTIMSILTSALWSVSVVESIEECLLEGYKVVKFHNSYMKALCNFDINVGYMYKYKYEYISHSTIKLTECEIVTQ